MAGGTWTSQNKVRPGAYINFNSAGEALGSMGDRGTVTIPMIMDFGPVKKVIAVEKGTNLVEMFGYSPLLIKEALKRASKVLVYRVNAGAKATKTAGSLTVTAKYEGTIGNNITVSIVADVDDPKLFTVATHLDGKVVYEQAGKTIESLGSNPYVDFSGTGNLVANAGIVLVGGTTGTAVTGDYMHYFTAIEVHSFNTLALPVADNTIKSACVSFIKKLREDEGNKVQAVLSDYPSADYEGIISVKNGVILTDGTVIDSVKATAWVAGATAGAFVNQSNTYTAYDDAYDCDTKYTNTQIIEALTNGELVFIQKGGKAIVEQDINTLTSYTPNKGKAFAKNRVIRTIDAIGNDIGRIFSDYYIGKVDNNADGRNLFKAEIIKYLDTLKGLNAIDSFDASTDVIVNKGNEIDSILVELNIKPVDSVEKLYMSVVLG